jgi:hypothetical protein
MNAIIYQSTPPPWKDGGSEVEQWESGLVRVTQNYMVPRAQRESISSLNFARGFELADIDSPASDGIYIYPDPIISDMNNGLSKISVTAYGRINGSYSVDMTYIRVSVTINESTGNYYVPQYRIKWVTVDGELPVPSFINDLKRKDVIYVVGTNESLTDYTGFTRSYTYEPAPTSSYGVMKEQVITMTAYPAETVI